MTFRVKCTKCQWSGWSSECQKEEKEIQVNRVCPKCKSVLPEKVRESTSILHCPQCQSPVGPVFSKSGDLVDKP